MPHDHPDHDEDFPTLDDLPPARRVLRQGDWSGATDRVVLGYDQRFLRRRRLETQGGRGFLVDLAETTSLDEGDAFGIEDGQVIEVAAAAEPVAIVTGDLVRLAWHVGNRHTPCQIGADRLVIRQDHVLEAMLRQLGAHVAHAEAPFRPEGGAYGMGRTMGHDHGHDHGHGHGHHHGHGHAHVHHHSGHGHPGDDDAEDDGA